MNDVIVIEFEDLGNHRGIRPDVLATITGYLDRLLRIAADRAEAGNVEPTELIGVQAFCLRLVLKNALLEFKSTPLGATASAFTIAGGLAGLLLFARAALPAEPADPAAVEECRRQGQQLTSNDGAVGIAVELARSLAIVEGGKVTIYLPEAPALIIVDQTSQSVDWVASMARRPIIFLPGDVTQHYQGRISFDAPPTHAEYEGKVYPLLMARLDDYQDSSGRRIQVPPQVAVIWRSRYDIPNLARGTTQSETVRGTLVSSAPIKGVEPLDITFARADAVLIVEGVQRFE